MSKPKQRLWFVAIIVIFACLIEYLFDPIDPYTNKLALKKLQSELTVAKEKWTSQNINNYSVEVEYWVPLLGPCHGKITVINGEVIEVFEKTDRFDENSNFVAITKERRENDHCYYTDLTIPEVFESVQQVINEKITIEALFDPDLGFVTRYYGSQNVRRGLLNPWINDSEFSYFFRNFQKLEPTEP